VLQNEGAYLSIGFTDRCATTGDTNLVGNSKEEEEIVRVITCDIFF
jgi:hypothetical protein